MGPWLAGGFGNPSGSHSIARAARKAIEEARDTVADCLGVLPGNVVFTGGGTESDNLAVLGRARAVPGPLAVSAIEHHAVLHAAHAAERLAGTPVRTVGCGTDGIVDLDALSLRSGRQREHGLRSAGQQRGGDPAALGRGRSHSAPARPACGVAHRRRPGRALVRHRPVGGGCGPGERQCPQVRRAAGCGRPGSPPARGTGAAPLRRSSGTRAKGGHAQRRRDRRHGGRSRSHFAAAGRGRAAASGPCGTGCWPVCSPARLRPTRRRRDGKRRLATVT